MGKGNSLSRKRNAIPIIIKQMFLLYGDECSYYSIQVWKTVCKSMIIFSVTTFWVTLSVPRITKKWFYKKQNGANDQICWYESNSYTHRNSASIPTWTKLFSHFGRFSVKKIISNTEVENRYHVSHSLIRLYRNWW